MLATKPHSWDTRERIWRKFLSTTSEYPAYHSCTASCNSSAIVGVIVGIFRLISVSQFYTGGPSPLCDVIASLIATSILILKENFKLLKLPLCLHGSVETDIGIEPKWLFTRDPLGLLNFPHLSPSFIKTVVVGGGINCIMQADNKSHPWPTSLHFLPAPLLPLKLIRPAKAHGWQVANVWQQVSQPQSYVTCVKVVESSGNVTATTQPHFTFTIAVVVDYLHSTFRQSVHKVARLVAHTTTVELW